MNEMRVVGTTTRSMCVCVCWSVHLCMDMIYTGSTVCSTLYRCCSITEKIKEDGDLFF